MEKNFKGTPGQWFYYHDPLDFQNSKAGSFRVKAADAAHTPVCTVPNPIGRYSEKQEANARLIAAAPELLEALREIVTTFDPDKQGIYEFARDRIDAAKAAITKALEG